MTKDKLARWVRQHENEIATATIVGIGLCTLSLTMTIHKVVRVQNQAMKADALFPKTWTFTPLQMDAYQTSPTDLYLKPWKTIAA